MVHLLPLQAYQPKGAVDYATSKINLANPGTYDAADGANFPTWNNVNGWIFDGINQFLTTGVVPAAGWSAIVRFSNVTNNFYIFGGTGDESATLSIIPSFSDNKVYYYNGGFVAVAPGLLSGTLGVTGTDAYRNGVDDGNIGAWVGAGGAIDIGRLRADYGKAYIQAIAFYNTILTAVQISALHTAMAAL